MVDRIVIDEQPDAHFITFSCYKRRRYLDLDRTKQSVLGTLEIQVRNSSGCCCGFVVMPDHVHVIVWFPVAGGVSQFIERWKTDSSAHVKRLLQQFAPHYLERMEPNEPIWQAKFYDFNVFTERKLQEKLDYMHLNPVRERLASRVIDWKWSSARWYAEHKPVGVTISVPPGVM